MRFKQQLKQPGIRQCRQLCYLVWSKIPLCMGTQGHGCMMVLCKVGKARVPGMPRARRPRPRRPARPPRLQRCRRARPAAGPPSTAPPGASKTSYGVVKHRPAWQAHTAVPTLLHLHLKDAMERPLLRQAQQHALCQYMVGSSSYALILYGPSSMDMRAGTWVAPKRGARRGSCCSMAPSVSTVCSTKSSSSRRSASRATSAVPCQALSTKHYQDPRRCQGAAVIHVAHTAVQYNV